MPLAAAYLPLSESIAKAVLDEMKTATPTRPAARASAAYVPLTRRRTSCGATNIAMSSTLSATSNRFMSMSPMSLLS